MNALNDLVDRYVATWNEPDAARRRRAVREMWTADGIHRSRTIEASGRDELEARAADTYEKWGIKGYIFRRVDDADGHHDAVRFRWEMVPGRRRPGGGGCHGFHRARARRPHPAGLPVHRSAAVLESAFIGKRTPQAGRRS